MLAGKGWVKMTLKNKEEDQKLNHGLMFKPIYGAHPSFFQPWAKQSLMSRKHRQFFRLIAESTQGFAAVLPWCVLLICGPCCNNSKWSLSLSLVCCCLKIIIIPGSKGIFLYFDWRERKGAFFLNAFSWMNILFMLCLSLGQARTYKLSLIVKNASRCLNAPSYPSRSGNQDKLIHRWCHCKRSGKGKSNLIQIMGRYWLMNQVVQKENWITLEMLLWLRMKGFVLWTLYIAYNSI